MSNNRISTYLINAREIKKWMEERNTTKPPSTNSKDEEEKRLGVALHTIRIYYLNKYKKLPTEEERKMYKKKYPYFEEVKRIVDEIDRNNLPIKLIQAMKIKKWMEERKTIKPPVPSYLKDAEEKRLGLALNSIKQYLLKPYEQLETEEEREEYKRKHPEYEEVKQIVDEIDRNNLPIKLIQAIEIKEWMEENKTTKPPSSSSKDKEEQKLGQALNSIKQYLLKPYEQLETEEEREEYKRKHPEYEEVKQIVDEIDRNSLSQYLINAREIKKWMEEKNITNFPSKNSDDEEERRLAVALLNIRQQFLKPYQKLKTSLDRELYKKRYPYFNEVKEIIDEIDKIKFFPYLVNARLIKQWMQEKNTVRPPFKTSKDEEEKELGHVLESIKRYMRSLNNYLKTEEERNEYEKTHPEYKEVKEILDEVEKKYFQYFYLVNIMKVKEWMEQNNIYIPPSSESENKEERKYGKILDTIRKYLQQPDESFDTIDKRKEYIEVKHIIEEIDSKKVLKELVEEDISKREMLEKAKKLEASYEKQLKDKKKSKDVGDSDDE